MWKNVHSSRFTKIKLFLFFSIKQRIVLDLSRVAAAAYVTRFLASAGRKKRAMKADCSEEYFKIATVQSKHDLSKPKTSLIRDFRRSTLQCSNEIRRRLPWQQQLFYVQCKCFEYLHFLQYLYIATNSMVKIKKDHG